MNIVFLCGHVFISLGFIYLGEELLCHILTPVYILKIAPLLPKVTGGCFIYSSTGSVCIY